MPIRLTASSTSVVRRNKRKREVLGSDLLHIVEDELAEARSSDLASRREKREARLEVIDYSVRIDSELSDLSDVVVGIKVVLSRMWEKIPEKGTRLNRDGVADLLRFRKSVPPVVTVAHLHALYPSDPTFIDRELQRVAENGQVRKLIVNINTGDVVIESNNYFKILEDASNKFNEFTYKNFELLLKENPVATSFLAQELEEYGISEDSGIRDLLSTGFLVLSSTPGKYLASIPNIGAYLKLNTKPRKWIVRQLERAKWKELLEKSIHERWDSNVSNLWRDFRGVSFDWAMMECKGGGWIEPFLTPAGIGWKLTGKKD
ncbi:bifunctional purine biosynthesis protein purH [Dipodascopsis uninucleata]